MWFLVLFFVMTVYIYISGFKYILMNLMAMELMIVSLLMILYYLMILSSSEYYFLFLMVVFVSHSVVGLCILVNLIRFYGYDSSKYLMLMMW